MVPEQLPNLVSFNHFLLQNIFLRSGEPVAVPQPSVEELTYASAADGYYYYVHIKTGKYFALDEVGYWYVVLLSYKHTHYARRYYQTEAGDYAMCGGVEQTAQPIAATAVSSDDAQLVPFDGDGRPMFPKDLQGHYVLPTDIHGIQKFPLDSEGNALFPWDPDTKTYTFPIGVDGQPLFPLNRNGTPALTLVVADVLCRQASSTGFGRRPSDLSAWTRRPYGVSGAQRSAGARVHTSS